MHVKDESKEVQTPIRMWRRRHDDEAGPPRNPLRGSRTSWLAVALAMCGSVLSLSLTLPQANVPTPALLVTLMVLALAFGYGLFALHQTITTPYVPRHRPDRCPVCGYDLSGVAEMLTRVKCAECGSQLQVMQEHEWR